MKLSVTVTIVLMLVALPALPMPAACCYRVSAAAAHPCCPATSNRIPTPRATTRVPAAAVTIAQRLQAVPQVPPEPSEGEPAPRALRSAALATTQLRI